MNNFKYIVILLGLLFQGFAAEGSTQQEETTGSGGSLEYIYNHEISAKSPSKNVTNLLGWLSRLEKTKIDRNYTGIQSTLGGYFFRELRLNSASTEIVLTESTFTRQLTIIEGPNEYTLIRQFTTPQQDRQVGKLFLFSSSGLCGERSFNRDFSKSNRSYLLDAPTKQDNFNKDLKSMLMILVGQNGKTFNYGLIKKTKFRGLLTQDHIATLHGGWLEQAFAWGWLESL